MVSTTSEHGTPPQNTASVYMSVYTAAAAQGRVLTVLQGGKKGAA
jgi:hypothetical protein